MTTWTGRLVAIVFANVTTTAILALRNRLQMLRVNTTRHPAKMIQHHPAWDLTVMLDIGLAMRKDRFAG